MKAVITEIKNDRAAVLCADGSVREIPNRGYSIGQETDIAEDRKLQIAVIRNVCIAAAALIVCLAGVGLGMPCGVVSLDVNPSIEYRINRLDMVVSAAGRNDEGKEELAKIYGSSVHFHSIDSAIEGTLEQLAKDEYLTDGKRVVIATQTYNAEHSSKITERLGEKLASAYSGLMLTTATRAEVKAAHDVGKTAGQIAAEMKAEQEKDVKTVKKTTEDTETEEQNEEKNTETTVQPAQTQDQPVTAENSQTTAQDPAASDQTDEEDAAGEDIAGSSSGQSSSDSVNDDYDSYENDDYYDDYYDDGYDDDWYDDYDDSDDGWYDDYDDSDDDWYDDYDDGWYDDYDDDWDDGGWDDEW